MSTIIRPFEEKDTHSVVQLWQDCGLTVPWNDPVEDIQRKLAVGAELFLVAELNGKVIASVMGGYEGHRGWANYLAVDPNQQKQGHGVELMTHLEQLLLEKGCPKINLQVRSSNQTVIEFYQSLGYGVDEVTSMGKRLIADDK